MKVDRYVKCKIILILTLINLGKNTMLSVSLVFSGNFRVCFINTKDGYKTKLHLIFYGGSEVQLSNRYRECEQSVFFFQGLSMARGEGSKKPVSTEDVNISQGCCLLRS